MQPIETTNKCINNFLKYYAIHPNTKIRYYTSDILLKMHSDAS